MIYIRPFHYPEDHGGVNPKDLSPFVGPKSKILEKLKLSGAKSDFHQPNTANLPNLAALKLSRAET